MENVLYTTILIKRRVSGDPGPPPMLQHGELAVNEVGSTLYIGTTNTENLSGENFVTDMGKF
jgi:hypothetical protein